VRGALGDRRPYRDQKIVIPGFMDDTPLAVELSVIHGVDLRDSDTHRTGAYIEA